MENKVYVIFEESVLDDNFLTDVVAVADNEATAKQILKDYIKKIKKDIDFDSLDAIEDNEELDLDEHDGDWIYTEESDYFSLFENGEYNSNHIEIGINIMPILKEYNNEIKL